MLTEINDHRENLIIYYLVFLIGLEFVLRFGFGFSVWLFTKRPVRTKTKRNLRLSEVQESGPLTRCESESEHVESVNGRAY